jgi:hypothetical protein
MLQFYTYQFLGNIHKREMLHYFHKVNTEITLESLNRCTLCYIGIVAL